MINVQNIAVKLEFWTFYDVISIVYLTIIPWAQMGS